MIKKTYWLYEQHSTRVLTAVRMTGSPSDIDIRNKAIDDEFRCPIGNDSKFETPREFCNRLLQADFQESMTKRA